MSKNRFETIFSLLSLKMEDLREKLLQALESQDVWLNFDTGLFVSDDQIREMIRLGKLDPNSVSSRPDIFPVFGDLEKATKLVRSAGQEVQQRGDSVEYECHKGVTGFKNPGDSCFMDSTLMSMFFLVDSPFYDGIFNAMVSSGGAQCSRDPAENKRLKEEVKALIKSDVERIIKGEVGYKCVKLRNLIGKTCRGDDEDMSRGTHDAALGLVVMPLTVITKNRVNPIIAISHTNRPRWTLGTAVIAA